MKRWIPLIVSIAAVLAMFAFIFYMSARPADQSDSMSLGFIGRFIGFIVPGYDQMSLADQMQWQHTLNTPVRKLAHFTEYAVLGALMLNAVFQAMRACANFKPLEDIIPKRTFFIAWGLSTLYAVTDEIHQQFVPGRTGKPTDVLIDSSGALVGVLIAALIILLIAKRRKSRQSGKA